MYNIRSTVIATAAAKFAVSVKYNDAELMGLEIENP
jgi:hypothetical protein